MNLQQKHDALFGLIEARRSVRAYLKRPVERERLERLIGIAGRAPSGGNVQPWQVHVLQGKSKEKLEKAILKVFHDPDHKEEPEYRYYPRKKHDLAYQRRVEVAMQLYSALGIDANDRSAKTRELAKNFTFFGAPVGFILSTDRSMELGGWIDMGIFIANLLLTAEAEGLATCAQAAFASFPDTTRSVLGLNQNERIVCGVSLGYADLNAAVNSFTTSRVKLENFVRFYD